MFINKAKVTGQLTNDIYILLNREIAIPITHQEIQANTDSNLPSLFSWLSGSSPTQFSVTDPPKQ
jgi:hypothetical protein